MIGIFGSDLLLTRQRIWTLSICLDLTPQAGADDGDTGTLLFVSLTCPSNFGHCFARELGY